MRRLWLLAFFSMLLFFCVSCAGAAEESVATPSALPAASDAPLQIATTTVTAGDNLAAAEDNGVTLPQAPVVEPPDINTPTLTEHGADETAVPPSPPESSPPSLLPETTPTETATTVATVPLRPLEEQWYVDSDGNMIPDFLEIELGHDPFADDCAPAACMVQPGQGAALREQNILIILDASGSMAESAGSQTRMEAAKEAIGDYVSVTADLVNLGFMVLGHQGDNTLAGKDASCAGVELLAPIGAVTAVEFEAILATIQPNGWTPLAAALAAAEAAFAGDSGADNKVILITDGLETCAGDPVAVAQQLHLNPDLKLIVDVVGFALQNADEVAQLRQIAEAGNGVFVDAQTTQDVRDYFNESANEVFERFNFALCVVENSVNYATCSNQMVLNATLFIQPLQIGADSSQANGYRALIEAIRNAKEASDSRYNAYKQQMNELLIQQETWQQRRQELFGDN